MTVKKCDRCGAIYQNGYELDYEMYEMCGVERLPIQDNYPVVDLCEKCKKDFNKWIGSQPKEIEG